MSNLNNAPTPVMNPEIPSTYFIVPESIIVSGGHTEKQKLPYLCIKVNSTNSLTFYDKDVTNVNGQLVIRVKSKTKDEKERVYETLGTTNVTISYSQLLNLLKDMGCTNTDKPKKVVNVQAVKGLFV